MVNNPEQGWAGAVALAFELMAWGCEQLFSFTAPWASWREEWVGVLNLHGDLAQHFSKEAGVLTGCCTAGLPLALLC